MAKETKDCLTRDTISQDNDVTDNQTLLSDNDLNQIQGGRRIDPRGEVVASVTRYFCTQCNWESSWYTSDDYEGRSKEAEAHRAETGHWNFNTLTDQFYVK